jgi:hypothetical protein
MLSESIWFRAGARNWHFAHDIEIFEPHKTQGAFWLGVAKKDSVPLSYSAKKIIRVSARIIEVTNREACLL